MNKPFTCHDVQAPALTRREALLRASAGFGYLAFAGLCAEAAQSTSSTATAPTAPVGYQSPLLPKKPHFAPKAKRVIFMCMQGGPSHLDTFDYKPMLSGVGSSSG